MIRTAAGAGFSRRYDYRRYKLTLGYTLFYACGLFALSFLISRFAASAASAVPAFIRLTAAGQMYVYNLIAFAGVALALIINPRMLIFDDIPTNRWNLFFKSGISAGRLIANKLFFCTGSILRVYLTGAGLSLALGVLVRSGQSAARVPELLLFVLLGVCMLLTLVMPGVFFGSFLYNRFALSGICLAAAAGVGGILYLFGYFRAQSESAALAAVRALVRLAPNALSVIAAACLVLFSVGAFLIASSKLRNYEVEELDDEELLRLGVTRDIVVYEQSGGDLKVAISGPELFSAGNDSVAAAVSFDSEDDKRSASRSRR